MTYFPSGSGDQWQGQGFAPSSLRVRPRRAWYLIALAIVLAGIAWLLVGLAALDGTISGLQRVPLPAGGTVSLTHSGGYSIYYEGPGASSGDFPSFNVDVAPASTGAHVGGLTRYGSVVTYDSGTHHGRAVLALRVTGPGRFKVKVTGTPPAGADLAIGGSVGSDITRAIVPALPLIAVGLVAALVLLIIRSISKRSVRRQNLGPGVS